MKQINKNNVEKNNEKNNSEYVLVENLGIYEIDYSDHTATFRGQLKPEEQNSNYIYLEQYPFFKYLDAKGFTIYGQPEEIENEDVDSLTQNIERIEKEIKEVKRLLKVKRLQIRGVE